MAVLRQLNILGQQRLDVPHIRSIESSIAGDFDVLAGRYSAGGNPLVIRGFTFSNITAGGAANAIQVATADSILFNVNATEAGTFLWIPDDRAVETLNSTTNSRVSGSFASNQTNYIGVDFLRSADDTTSDLVQFLDANTLLEVPKTVPLGRTLDYKIVISTTSFSAQSNVIPLAKVVTDSSNNITSVEDARPMMFRLGSGGDSPNTRSSFSWINRHESSATNAFSAADKLFASQKDWQDAVMSRLWEIGGGKYWYSPTADRNVKSTRDPLNLFSNGENYEFVSSNLHWKGMSLVFDNSQETGVYYNAIKDQLTDSAGLTDIAVGECIYVDVDRTQNLSGVSALQPVKTTLAALNTPTIPGSRYILFWRDSLGIHSRDSIFPVGYGNFPVATTTSNGAVRLAYAAGTPANPYVTPLDANNAISVGTGSYPIIGNNIAIFGRGGGTSYGVAGWGGSSGGDGVRGIGGTYASGDGGDGGSFVAGAGASGFSGGNGISTQGVSGSSGNVIAGHGVYSQGGNGLGTGTGGHGVYAEGGDGGATSAEGGRGGYFTGGNAGGGNADGGDGVYSLGGNGTGTGGAGHGIIANGGAHGASAPTGSAGIGVLATGGNSTLTGVTGGHGGRLTGGNATTGNADGGDGVQGFGGTKTGTGGAGHGVYGYSYGPGRAGTMGLSAGVVGDGAAPGTLTWGLAAVAAGGSVVNTNVFYCKGYATYGDNDPSSAGATAISGVTAAWPLTTRNIIKAWAMVYYNGASYSLARSWNVSGVSTSGTGLVTLTLSTPVHYVSASNRSAAIANATTNDTGSALATAIAGVWSTTSVEVILRWSSPASGYVDTSFAVVVL